MHCDCKVWFEWRVCLLVVRVPRALVKAEAKRAIGFGVCRRERVDGVRLAEEMKL